MPELDIRDCVNVTCPWSGDPVSPDSLTLYRGRVVGFCNPGCRDKFDRAIVRFEAALAAPETGSAPDRPAADGPSCTT